MSLAYTVNGITVTYLGRTEFAENSLPFLAESADGGLDSLTRTFIGAAPLLAAFLGGLVKGGTFVYNGDTYFLLNWTPNGDKLWPEVSLNWVGLSNGAPDPIGDDDYSVQTITITGQVPSDDPDAEAGTNMSAERQIEYIAAQTTWRYITDERPTTALVGTTATGVGPFILRSVITTETGHTYAGANAPAGIVTATTPGVADMVLSLRATEVYGSPFFLVEEVVARMFFG